MMRFTKPSLTLERQLDLLIDRGLIVSDRERALRYLSFIGYYRLSGYMLRFQVGGNEQDQHSFIGKVTFDEIIDDYVFDRHLRLLTMDALERIEVAVKAVTFNHLAEQFGPHWYLNPSVFRNRGAHSRFVDEVHEATGSFRDANSQRRTPFLNHYFQKYNSPPLPPSWMISEVLSLGTVSRAYRDLKHKNVQKAIMSKFGAPRIDVFESWLHSLTYCRNLCAHHSRLWNRAFTIQMKAKNVWKPHLGLDGTRKFYGMAVLITHLLGIVSPGSNWPGRLRTLLLHDYPEIPKGEMGFPERWDEDEFWVHAFEAQQDE
jgi:abortive infection bacteriophage resistance protein